MTDKIKKIILIFLYTILVIIFIGVFNRYQLFIANDHSSNNLYVFRINRITGKTYYYSPTIDPAFSGAWREIK